MTGRKSTMFAGLAAATLAAPMLLVSSLTAAAAPAVAVSQDTPPADACTKTINAMGASMGHTTDVSPDGRPVYRFVLRTSGLDYDVVCDAASGIVNDVTPRSSH